MRGQNSTTEARDVWTWALSWYRRADADPGRRVCQAGYISRLLAVLAEDRDLDALHTRYNLDSLWAVQIARDYDPVDFASLGVHACVAAAFCLRFVELMTGQSVNPYRLPTWIGEWTD